ncbi:MAG: hypothetical protein RLZZ76_581 [Candidatus Parcubacteria bacterium]
MVEIESTSELGYLHESTVRSFSFDLDSARIRETKSYVVDP